MTKIDVGSKAIYQGRKVIVKGINENTHEATIVGERENPYVDIGKLVKTDELERIETDERK